MKIRNFEKNDKQMFLEMCQDFYTSGAALEPIPTQQMEETFDYIINDGTYTKGFIIQHEEKIAGYGIAFLYYSNEVGGLCGFLDEIYVSPDFRGEGLGSEYLNDISRILGKDVKGLRLEVCHSNKRAIKLYENSGFKALDYKQLVKSI